ncbi:hypothetical protein BY458DRAFT_169099 [Sporodiniella umbellata]|nr:hypothetical protein BY458DRAFT_169099 [Sporodiniella umbellata]
MNRAESIHSIDSVDLDDLINANYTTDMGDETDLPDLAYLDIIDDSTEDFWNLNLSDEATSSSDNEFNEFMLTSVELEWDSPTEKVPAPRLKKALYPHKRSGSFSSDTSLASQSTFRYSSLHSSRPVSRQSNTSSPRSPRIPTPTRSTKKSSSIPTPFNRTGQMPCRSPTLSSRLFPEESRIPSPTQRPSGLRTPSTVSTLFPKKTRNKVIQLTALK